MYSVAEISKLLGVSDKTIYRYLGKHEKALEKYLGQNENGKKAITRPGLEKLAELENKKIEWPTSEKKSHSKDTYQNDTGKYNRYIQLLESQLKQKDNQLQQKDNQLKEKDNHINNLTKLLDQQQQLQQNQMKLLEVNADTHKHDEQVNETPTAPQENEHRGIFDRLKGLFVSK